MQPDEVDLMPRSQVRLISRQNPIQMQFPSWARSEWGNKGRNRSCCDIAPNTKL